MANWLRRIFGPSVPPAPPNPYREDDDAEVRQLLDETARSIDRVLEKHAELKKHQALEQAFQSIKQVRADVASRR